MPWTSIITAWILRSLSNKNPHVANPKELHFEDGFASTAEYFARLGNRVNFRGKTVLDVGCYVGSLCFYMGINGATKVVGTDINEEAINFAKSKLAEYPGLGNVISFFLFRDLPEEQFDIVMSKDSFEHYSDPESVMDTMKQHLKPEGIIVVGFGSLWKSPYGGHINSFSRVPWIHLLFPEPILMQELRRFYKDQGIKSFGQIGGSGLNKITYKRFLKIAKENGLKFDYIATNLTSQPLEKCILRIFKMLSLFSPIREYFTANLYGILRPNQG